MKESLQYLASKVRSNLVQTDGVWKCKPRPKLKQGGPVYFDFEKPREARSPYPSPESGVEEKATLHGAECRNYSTRRKPYQHTLITSHKVEHRTLDVWEKGEVQWRKQNEKGTAERLKPRHCAFNERHSRRAAADAKRGFIRI